VTPETGNYLDKASTDLSEAEKIAAIGLATAAARSAYYAAFHTAEAFISERTGKIAKTHSGVRTEFSRLARGTPSIGKKFTTFLAQAYMYKEISDYSVEPDATVTIAEAEDAIVTAAQFLGCITTELTASS
jgi:uncharacterized protein (UPF0332 family)